MKEEKKVVRSKELVAHEKKIKALRAKIDTKCKQAKAKVKQIVKLISEVEKLGDEVTSIKNDKDLSIAISLLFSGIYPSEILQPLNDSKFMDAYVESRIRSKITKAQVFLESLGIKKPEIMKPMSLPF